MEHPGTYRGCIDDTPNFKNYNTMVSFVGKEVVWAEAEIVKDSNNEIPVPNFTKFMLQCLENTDCDRKCIAVGLSK